jgi:hypothetical protein
MGTTGVFLKLQKYLEKTAMTMSLMLVIGLNLCHLDQWCISKHAEAWSPWVVF